MLLADKTAIVTGAGSGVGRASALLFAEEGARVVCADIAHEAVKETVRLIEAAGGSAAAEQCDVSSDAEVAALVAGAVAQFGHLDVIFNNVGIPTPKLGMALEDHSVEDFDRLFAVNVRSVFLGTKHAMMQFKQQGTGGAIVNTGSVAGLVAWGGSVYGGTKGAVHQLTRSAAIEGAPFGIRANAICPAGMPATGFFAAGMKGVSAEQLEQAASMAAASHPLGRAITAEDCAHAAAFLASDKAANITGVLVPIDGGYVAR